MDRRLNADCGEARATLVRDVHDWAASLQTGRGRTHLTPTMVPGSTIHERRALTALGGIVKGLVPTREWHDWPEAVRRWLDTAPTASTTLVAQVADELNNDVDIFEWLYDRLVSGPSRRRLGTFFTPPPIVEHMLDMIGADAPPRIVDAGAGVGAFATACATRWPGSEVVAIDLNVVTLGLLMARTTLADLPVTAVHADFLRWIVHDCSHEPTLFLGNPPYTRHQGLPAKLKDRAQASTNGLVPSRLAGMSTYFLGAMLAHAKPQDSLCLLLPGSWLEANYGRELRRHLWRTQRTVELTGFGTDEEVFPGTRVTATIVLISAEGVAGKAPQFTTRRAVLHPDQVVQLNASELARDVDDPPPLGAVLWHRPRDKSQGVLRLGDSATVRRGVATGANEFFFLSDEQRSALPKSASVPAVRRLRHVRGDVLDAREHARIVKQHTGWLLWLHDHFLVDDPAVQSLLALAPDEIRTRELLRRRGADWFVVEHCKPPTILISTSSRNAVRAVHNRHGAIPSNSMYGIYLPDHADGLAFTNWWNSAEGQAAVLDCARHYSNGLLKLQPRDVLEVRVPSRPPW